MEFRGKPLPLGMRSLTLLSSNVVNLYSSGLNLQTIGLYVKRWQATLIDMVICTVLAAIAIFNANFNTLYSQFLSLMILFLAPWCATLWLNSPLLQGPLSHLFGGSDLSIFTGFIVGGVLYWILAHVFTLQMNPAHLAQHAIELEPSDG